MALLAPQQAIRLERLRTELDDALEQAMHEAYSGQSAQDTKEQWDEYYRQQAMYEQAHLHQDGGPTAAEAHAAEAVQPAYDKQIPEVPRHRAHEGEDWQA